MAVVKLGSVAKEFRQNWTGPKEGVPIVGLEHLTPEEITLSSWDHDTENTFSKKFEKGQVLLGRRRVYLKKAVIAPFDGICSGDITVIEAIPGKIVPELLPFIIQNDKFFDYAMQGSAGSLSPRVKWEHLKDYEFDIPDIPAQHTLADKLWAAYRLKQSYQSLIDAAGEMVKSRFIEMFGGIQNGTQWPIKKLSDLCYLINGYAFKSFKYSTSGYSVIRIANVQKGYIDDSDRVCYPFELKSEFEDSILREGDILISLTGNVGRVGVVTNKLLPAALNQRVQGLRIKDEQVIDRGFLFNILNLDDFESLCIENSSGSAQLNLSTIWVREFPIICPSLDKQREFSAFANQADKSKFELEQAIDKIDKVMRSLIG